jgi:DNA-binding protein HU-beta
MDKKVNRKEVIDRLSVAADAYKKDSEIFLDAFLEVVAEALANGESVNLRGFGTFEVNERKTCKTKHPLTGELMEIPGHKICKFTQSPKLRERIN